MALRDLRMEEIREKLAELSHRQWSGWMSYLFLKCSKLKTEFSYLNMENEKQKDFKEYTVIPEWGVNRWQKQLITSYGTLSEEEKGSDRIEADRVLNIEILTGVTIKDAIKFSLKNKESLLIMKDGGLL